LVVVMLTRAALVADDVNDRTDLYRRLLDAGQVDRISIRQDGTALEPVGTRAAVASDGCLVAFSYAADHVGGTGIALFDCQVGVVGEVFENAFGDPPGLSSDGRYLAFRATRSIHGDDTLVTVLVDRQTGTERVFLPTGGFPDGAYDLSSSGGTLVSAQSSDPASVFAHGLLPDVPTRCESVIACDGNQEAILDMASCGLARLFRAGACAEVVPTRPMQRALDGAQKRLRKGAEFDEGAKRRRRAIRSALRSMSRASGKARRAMGRSSLNPACGAHVRHSLSEIRAELKSGGP
jgi:hypothetical protein